jgi:hypothetical protein
MPEDIGLIDLHLHPKGLSKREFRALEEILNINIYDRMFGDVLPTHLVILSRATIGLRMKSTTS